MSFANLSPEKRHEIARKGGIAAHAKGKAHQFTSDEARTAGRKGGDAVSKIPGHMSRIGKMGGLAATARPRKKNVAKDLAPLGEREIDPE